MVRHFLWLFSLLSSGLSPGPPCGLGSPHEPVNAEGSEVLPRHRWQAGPSLRSAHRWNSLCFPGRVPGASVGEVGHPREPCGLEAKPPLGLVSITLLRGKQTQPPRATASHHAREGIVSHATLFSSPQVSCGSHRRTQGGGCGVWVGDPLLVSTGSSGPIRGKDLPPATPPFPM